MATRNIHLFYFWGADGNEYNRVNIQIDFLALDLRLEKAYEAADMKIVGTATDNGYTTELTITVTNSDLKRMLDSKLLSSTTTDVPPVK